MRRLRHPSGSLWITPPRRTSVPWPAPSTMVLAVPGETAEADWMPSASAVASGTACLSLHATQSVAITSKPTPGQRTNPAARAGAARKLEDVDLARDVEIMRARRDRGLHHRPRGR